MKSTATTAIIPVFNEEMSVGSKVLRTKKYVDRVIVIDNGSADNTVEIAHLAGAEVIRHTGSMTDVLKTGINIASQNGTKIILAIDSDDKHYIDIIPETIDCIKNNNYDMVVGSFSNSKISKEGSYDDKIKFLAFSIESLNKIDLTKLNGHVAIDILRHAEKNKLKIKYLNSEQFNGYNIGVVVPAYNEEQLIEKTIKSIPRYVKKIYIVDDCSTDNTPKIIKSLNSSRVLYVRHEKNRGVGAAIVTGYKLALGDDIDVIAVMAGDNQMDPEQLPRLILPIIENKADYTKGNRLINKNFLHGMSKWRFFGNVVLTMITKIGSGYWHITDPQNGYTVISRKALERIDLDSIYHYYGYCNDILIKMNTIGMIVEDIAMPSRYGDEKSKIKYGRYMIKVAPMIFKGFLWRLKTKYMILDFHPLVFFYFASMLLLPFGILFSLWILYQKIYHNTVSPNYPLLAAFTTLMGLLLLLFAMFFDMDVNNNTRRVL